MFTSSIGQLSPGAYLLRVNLFPALCEIVKTSAPSSNSGTEPPNPDSDEGELTFDAVVLLSLLAGFHRTDAPRLNGYLRAVGEVEDRECTYV